MTRPLLLALALVSAAVATPALADPCTAAVTGLRPGAPIVGQVRHVIDGDSLCVGPSADPRTWVEIRLANWFAPELHGDQGGREAKAALASIADGRPARCTVARGYDGRTYSYDRVIATCAVSGHDVAGQLRAMGVREGGRGRR